MTKSPAFFTRREFLRHSGILAASLTAGQNPQKTGPFGRPLLDLHLLERFVDSLPISAAIKPSGTRAHPDHPSSQIPFYRLTMRQMESKVHRDMKTTRLWGFEGASPGPTIETRSGEPLLVEWLNALPTSHFLPIDHTVTARKRTSPTCAS